MNALQLNTLNWISIHNLDNQIIAHNIKDKQNHDNWIFQKFVSQIILANAWVQN